MLCSLGRRAHYPHCNEHVWSTGENMSDGSACTGRDGEINLQLISQERMRSAVFKQVYTIVVIVCFCCPYQGTHLTMCPTEIHSNSKTAFYADYTGWQKQMFCNTKSARINACLWNCSLDIIAFVSVCDSVCVSLYFLLEYQHASCTSKLRTF